MGSAGQASQKISHMYKKKSELGEHESKIIQINDNIICKVGRFNS